MEAKITKTELSIEKLEKHNICVRCLKLLQYSAKPNVAVDILFEKELGEIKLKAEQSLISALTHFHKQKLTQEKKPVTRNPLTETPFANNTVNNNADKANLQKQISSSLACTQIYLKRREWK